MAELYVMPNNDHRHGTSADDLVVGTIGLCKWERIEPWVLSLERCGYTGKKAAIAYNAADDVIEQLIARGFHIKPIAHHSRHLNVDRCCFLWQLLQKAKARYVIATETRELVFQTNPSLWLEKHLAPFRVIVGSEGVAYKDAPGGNCDMAAFFGPEVRAWMKDKVVYASESIAGEATAVSDLCLNIYLMGYHNIVPFATDQAALNILINLIPWREITRLSSMADGWACYAANVADPMKLKTIRPFLKEPEPVLGTDGFVYPAGSSTPFCIVGQYKRNPAWQSAIMSRYSS
jgi:hypothetical protein